MYKEIQSGAVAKFLKYEEMSNYFPIYHETVSHIRLCNCSMLNFPIYEENLIFFFISAESCMPQQAGALSTLPPISLFSHHIPRATNPPKPPICTVYGQRERRLEEQGGRVRYFCPYWLEKGGWRNCLKGTGPRDKIQIYGQE